MMAQGRAEPVAPKVTVLLATFNGRRHVEEQVKTIFGQREVDVRLVISDDGSVDGTHKLVRGWAEADGRVTLLPVARAGSAAKNFYRLLLDAPLDGADFVALSDQDDLWHPDKLSRAVTLLRQAGAAGYSSNVVAVYPDGREHLVRKSQPQRRWDHLFSSAGPGCTYVVRASHLPALRDRLKVARAAADVVEFHDWLVYAWFRQHGLPWVIDDWPSMRYRQHGENVLGANTGPRAAARRAFETLGGGPLRQVDSLAEFIGADGERPVMLLRSGSRRDLLRLAAMNGELRRTRAAGLGLAMILLLRALGAGPYRGRRAPGSSPDGIEPGV
jgi:rhamnosyltransferase